MTSICTFEPITHPPVDSTILPTVLLVEDDRKMRELLTRQLREIGVEPYVTVDAVSAIRMAGDHRPQVIIIDGLLPVMHGFETARFLRHMDKDYTPHIVLLTGVYKALRYRNEAALLYGIDRYVLKPVSTPALRQLLEEVSERVCA